MRRRDFITGIGAAVAWPIAVVAQQPVPAVGFLSPSTPEADHILAEAFKLGLAETGYADGRNVTIVYRWANGQYERLSSLADELVQRPVAVIAAVNPVGAAAAMRATTSIPIVFALGSDPVKDRLVASINKPGGNITGATFFANLLDAKRLDLLRLLVPSANVVALLVNPDNSQAALQTDNAQKAARALGLQLVAVQARTADEVDDAIESIVRQGAAALDVAADSFLTSRGSQIVTLAGQHHLPTSFALRELAMAGGLMSYGASITDTLRQAGNYVGRVLRGEKPADLPVQQPSKFEFILNMKTAKALGLDVPSSLQLLADEVIE